MEDTLISFETAKLAKEKGFFIECERYFNEKGEMWTWHAWGEGLADCQFSNPTQSLLQKWLREEHSLFISVTTYSIECNRVNLIIDNNIKYAFEYKTYEEALEKGLFEALKLIL